MMMPLPEIALSVRQPWAWAIVFAGKDVEHRTHFAIRHGGLDVTTRFAVHAAKGMTRAEYEAAAKFIAKRIKVAVPPPAELVRGAIIGSVTSRGVAKSSFSRWYMGGPVLLLEEPCPIDEPVPVVGQLGFWRWRPSGGTPESALRWMIKWAEAQPTQQEAFDGV